MTSFETVEPDPELCRHYRASGWWTGETLTDLLADALESSAQRSFTVYTRHDSTRMSLRTLATWSRRLAAGLRRLGVTPGDPVAFQLPNSLPAAAIFYGLVHAGAILVPLGHTAGRSEVDRALRSTGARVLFIDEQSAGEELLDAVVSDQSRPPALEHVVTVGDGTTPPAMIAMDTLDDGYEAERWSHSDPAAPAVIGWTSGSTSAPKGVLLSHRALCAEIRLHMSALEIQRVRPMLSTSPVSHVTGMLISLLVPPLAARDVHLMDFWEPTRVAQLMHHGGLAAGSGAPYFLQSLLDNASAGANHHRLIDIAALGGAAVSPTLIERAQARGVRAIRGYGCTEHPSISLGRVSDSLEIRSGSDGYPCTGVDVCVRDGDGRRYATGTGEIVTRGPDLFSGYVDPEMNTAAFEDGWYRTGDVGILDDRGTLTVVDRLKDIIIRSGLNISASELEACLGSMPAVAEAAVVALPDERTGERACALIRPAPGYSLPALVHLQDHLAALGLSKYKWPEEIRLHSREFPRTPAGKVNKSVLRQWARQKLPDESTR